MLQALCYPERAPPVLLEKLLQAEVNPRECRLLALLQEGGVAGIEVYDDVVLRYETVERALLYMPSEGRYYALIDHRLEGVALLLEAAYL